jgi:hypothetical protein
MELLLKENSDLPLKNVNNFYVIGAALLIFSLAPCFKDNRIPCLL